MTRANRFIGWASQVELSEGANYIADWYMKEREWTLLEEATLMVDFSARELSETILDYK
jgi:dTDP-D-glucose 4,6-dehydratase